MRADKIQRARELCRQMTAAEQTLWHHLRNHQLAGLGFRRQQMIDGCIGDFFCSSAGLVIEVDGSVHVQQSTYDVERDRIIAARGLRILRVSNDAIQHDLTGVLSRIAAATRR